MSKVKEELAIGFTHRVGSSSLIIERYRPIFGPKYYVSYATFNSYADGQTYTSNSPRLRSYDEAYQWAWEQILEWCLNG